MTSVLIGYCHNGTVRAEFNECLIDLLVYEAKRKQLGRLERTSAGGPYIADNRNRIVRHLLEKTEAEWLLFLDNDMVFNANLLELLLAATSDWACSAKIRAGCYITLANGKTPVVAWLVRQNGKLCTLGEVEPNTIVELAVAGMGGTLIHREVFEAIRDTRREHPGGFAVGADNWEWFGHDLDQGERMGEDVTFCLRAAACGFKTYGVTVIQMGHMKVRQLDLSDLKDKI